MRRQRGKSRPFGVRVLEGCRTASSAAPAPSSVLPRVTPQVFESEQPKKATRAACRKSSFCTDMELPENTDDLREAACEVMGETHLVKDVRPLVFDDVKYDSVKGHCISCEPTCDGVLQAIRMHHSAACRHFGDDMSATAEEVIIWREMETCQGGDDKSVRFVRRQKRKLRREMAESTLPPSELVATALREGMDPDIVPAEGEVTRTRSGFKGKAKVSKNFGLSPSELKVYCETLAIPRQLDVEEWKLFVFTDKMRISKINDDTECIVPFSCHYFMDVTYQFLLKGQAMLPLGTRFAKMTGDATHDVHGKLKKALPCFCWNTFGL